MQLKKIGIIGKTGRIGKLLSEIIDKDQLLINGLGVNQTNITELQNVFHENDCIIDFSNYEITEKIIDTALEKPKALIICSTGWKNDLLDKKIKSLSDKAPVVIAPNTSIGSYIQKKLIKKIVSVISEEYDITIHESHHRNKKDAPSGTALNLAKDIIKSKKDHKNIDYYISDQNEIPRPSNVVTISYERAGNIIGEHNVKFTSENEIISLKHTVTNRALFAQGAVKIVHWLNDKKIEKGLYRLEDIYCDE